MSDSYSAAAWVSRPHPLHGLIQGQPAGDRASMIPNIRMWNLFNAVIPNYFALAATVDAAEQLNRDLQADAAMTVRWPTAPEEVSLEWLEEEAARRSGARSIDVQQQVLREAAFHARNDANELIDDHADALITELAKQLDELVAKATAAVDEVPAQVHTVVQAIETDAIDVWKALHNLRREYDEIRDVQRALYHGFRWPFDRAAAGDSNEVADVDARLYFHRNLPTVAPQWRGAATVNGFGDIQNQSVLPWPSDLTEKFVWCIRNDSGIWCPTTAQIAALLQAVPARNTQGVERKYQGVERRKSERQLLGTSAVRPLR